MKITSWLAIALMLLGPAAPVAAAPSRQAQLRGDRNDRTDAAEKAARAHFKKAERAFNVGKFVEALASYQAAFEAKPLPAFVFNIAQCHRNLNDPERALFFYRRYLALEPETPNNQLVESLIEEQQFKLAERERIAEAALASERAAAAIEPGGVAGSSSAASGRPDLSRAGRAEASDPVAGSLTRPAPGADAPPLHKRWWVWAAGGTLLAVTAAALLITREGPRPQGRLGSADFTK